MTRFLALCLAGAALITAAPGCGGGTSKEDYEKEVDEVGQTLEEQFTEIGRDIQSSGGLETAAPEIEKGSNALDEAATDLEGIEPPDDAQSAHEKIVAGIRDLADDFRAASKAAASNDAREVLALFGDIQASEGAKKIEEARTELRKAGYEVEE